MRRARATVRITIAVIAMTAVACGGEPSSTEMTQPSTSRASQSTTSTTRAIPSTTSLASTTSAAIEVTTTAATTVTPTTTTETGGVASAPTTTAEPPQPVDDGTDDPVATLPVSTAPSTLEGVSIDCTVTVVPVVGTDGDTRQVDLSIESNRPGATVYVALQWDDGSRRFEAPLANDGSARGRLDVPGVGTVTARVHTTPQFRPGDIACTTA